MPEAYLVDAVRTPVGRRGGGLSQIHPADLGGYVLSALMERTGGDPGAPMRPSICPKPSRIARAASLAQSTLCPRR